MSKPIRAGGHIIRNSGWELEYPPGVAAGVERRQDLPGGETGGSQAVQQQPDKADCPDCGKTVIVNKSGTLRKHTCVIDAPPPQVTFDDDDEQEEEGDG